MTIDTIVIGMDFSDTAITAATWTSRYVAPHARIILVHVIDVPDLPPFGRRMLPEPEVIEAAAREYATKRLREVASLLAPGTRTDIRVGTPHERIIEAARDADADLIVVGPHADRPRPSKFLGTTAERVVRTSPAPVLVAIKPPHRRPRSLLVPVDDLSITPTLLAWTRDLAEDFDADVTLLHVWSNAIYSHVASMSYAAKANEADARQEIANEIHDAGVHWLDEIARTGIRRDRVTASILHGNAGDVTVELAKTTHADLIVLGRRGTGLVAPALLGSTVGTVLHGAACPVLVVTDTPSAGHGQQR